MATRIQTGKKRSSSDNLPSTAESALVVVTAAAHP